MKMRYLKYLGGALMLGMVAGAVGVSVMSNARGLKGARKKAKKAMNAMCDLVDCAKHIVS